MDTFRLKLNGCRKRYCATPNQKGKSRKLILRETNLKAKKIIKDSDRHCMIIRIWLSSFLCHYNRIFKTG